MNLNKLHSLWLYSVLLAVAVSPFGAMAADTEAASSATNAVEKIETSAMSGQTWVKVTLRSPLPDVPSSFTISSPPRIAFDFPDTENATGGSSRQVSLSDLQSFNIVQAGTRTRMVLNLGKPNRYSARVEGKVLYITLGGGLRSTDKRGYT